MKLCLRCNQYFADGMAACPRDNSVLESVGKDPLIGALINDRYVVDSVIGKGSSGIVYKATRLMMGREVAVKVLHSFLGADSGSLDRVLREFAAASKLRHPHIITLWEHGITDDQQPYLVMDYLEGGTLADLIKERKFLHPSRALPIVEQVCDALSEAHSQEIVHRDIKPENIVLEEMGDGDDYVNDYVKVLDFGIADVPEAKSAQVGRPKTVAGSPAYMSPEQCQGMPLDARSDIYSMAVMVFEMLTGERPFQHEEHRALMLAHVTEPPIKLSAVRSDLQFPVELENVIAKALSKKPDARYADINEFWRSLKDACRGIKSPPASKGPSKKVDSVKVDAFEFSPEERLTDSDSRGQVLPWGDDVAAPPMPPPMPSSVAYTNEAARALAADIDGDLWALEPRRDEGPSTPAPLDPEKWLRQRSGENVHTPTNGESSFESGWGEDPSIFRPGQPPPPPAGYQPLPGLGVSPTIAPTINTSKPAAPSYASSSQPAQASPPPPPPPPPPSPNPALQPRRPLVQPPSKGGPAVPPVQKTGQNPVQAPPGQPAAAVQSGQLLRQPGATPVPPGQGTAPQGATGSPQMAAKPIAPAASFPPQAPAVTPAPAATGQPPAQNRPPIPGVPGGPQPQRIGTPAVPAQPQDKPAVPGLPQAQMIGAAGPQAQRTQPMGIPAQGNAAQPPQAVAGTSTLKPSQPGPPVAPAGTQKNIEIDEISRISSALELKFGDDEDDDGATSAQKEAARNSAAPVKSIPSADRKRADQTLIEPAISEDERLTHVPRDLADEPVPVPAPAPPPPPPPPAATPAPPPPPPPNPNPTPVKPMADAPEARTFADARPAVKPSELNKGKRPDQTIIEAAISEDELLTRAPGDVADTPAPAPPPPPPAATPAPPPPPPPAATPAPPPPPAAATPPPPPPAAATPPPPPPAAATPPPPPPPPPPPAATPAPPPPAAATPPPPPPPPPPPAATPAPAPPPPPPAAATPPPPPAPVKPVETSHTVAESKAPPGSADQIRPRRPDQTLIEAAIDESELLTRVATDVADEKPAKPAQPATAQALPAPPNQESFEEKEEKPVSAKTPDPFRPKRHDQTLIEAAIDEGELLTRAPKEAADDFSLKASEESRDFGSVDTPDRTAKDQDRFATDKAVTINQSVADRLAMAAKKTPITEKESQRETAGLPQAHNSATMPGELFSAGLTKPDKSPSDLMNSAAANFINQDTQASKPEPPASSGQAGSSSAAARLLQAAADKSATPPGQSKTGLGAMFAAKNAGHPSEDALEPAKPSGKPLENPVQSKAGMQSAGSAAKLSQTDLTAAEAAEKAPKSDPAAKPMESPTHRTAPPDTTQKKSTGLGNLLSAKLAQVPPPEEEELKPAAAPAKSDDSMTGMPAAKPQVSMSGLPAAPADSQTNLPSCAPEKPKAKSSGYFSAIQSRTNMPAAKAPESRPDPPKKSRTDLPAQSFESAASASFNSDFNATSGFNDESGFKGGGAQDRLAAAKALSGSQPELSDSPLPQGDEKISSAVSRLMEAAKRKEQDVSTRSGTFSSGASQSMQSSSLPQGGMSSGSLSAQPDLGSAASRLAAASGDANDALTSDLMNRFLEAANRGSELKKKASDANHARGQAINREMAQPSSAGPSMENAPQIDIAEQTQERLRMAMESTGKHAARPAPPKMPDLSSMRPSDLQLHQLTQMRGGGDLEINLDAPGAKKDSQTRSRMRSAFKNQGIDIRYVVLTLAFLIAGGAGYWFILKPILEKPPAPVVTAPNPAQQSFASGKFTKAIEVLEKKEKKTPLTDEEEDLLHHARFKQAEVFVKQKRFIEAKKLLKKIPEDSTHAPKVKALKDKYKKLRR